MRPIPGDIKLEIFRSYLEGLSIPEISKLSNVSIGTVFSIAKEETQNDELFLFLREIAKIIKKKNLNIYDLITAVRLNSVIEKLGLSSEFFEKFIISSDTKSFRLGINLDEFLNKIKDLIDFEKSTQIQIHDILPFIEKEKNLLDELLREKETIEKEINNLTGNIGFPKSQILEYIKYKPLFVRFKENTDLFHKSLDWIVYPVLFEKASNQIGRNIDPQILYNKLLSIYRKPHENLKLIRSILDYNYISSDNQ